MSVCHESDVSDVCCTEHAGGECGEEEDGSSRARLSMEAASPVSDEDQNTGTSAIRQRKKEK